MGNKVRLSERIFIIGVKTDCSCGWDYRGSDVAETRMVAAAHNNKAHKGKCRTYIGEYDCEANAI